MKISDEDLHQIILIATDKQLKALYKQYDKHLTVLLNDTSATEEQINTVADRILILSTAVDTTKCQPMELTPEFVKKKLTINLD